jgi:hypothetical protein
MRFVKPDLNNERDRMPPVSNKSILRMLNYHESAAATLRAALAILSAPVPRTGHHLNGDGGAGDVKRAALRVDAGRRAVLAASGKPKKKKPARWSAKRENQRQRTADYLAQFDRTDPRRPNEMKLIVSRGLGSYVRRGYLQAKGGGYVRTGKPYHVDPRQGA